MKIMPLIATLLILGLAQAGAQAGTMPSGGAPDSRPIQDHDVMMEVIRQFIVGQMDKGLDKPPEVVVQRPDPRLRLADCGRDLEAFLPDHARLQGKTTVGLRCTGTPGWKLYLTAEIHIYDKVAVAAKPLRRGDMLSAADIRLVDYDTSRLDRGYFASGAEADGMLLKRNVAAGTPLTPAMLAAPKLIKRGQNVILLAEGRALQIRASGTALGDGRKGERVKVRNDRSRQIVEGIVTAAGVVEFPF